MGTEVRDGQFRRFVVRIDEADGNATRGSGVLVAPGWVLSCAHVVEGLDVVSVVPDRRAVVDGDPPSGVTGRVRARSDSRTEGGGSAFWPFPDLALIELEGWSDHLFAPLVLAEPLRSGEPHAWGFGRREDGVAAVGSPASFVYVGVEGDGFLSLKAGDAPPGLSGAPLVCPIRRGVVAVMSVSRKPSDARGGWASPAAALAGEAGAGGELASTGAQIVHLNHDGAWRHRDAWNGVLPVTGADQAVDMPWEGLAGARPGVPSVMLRAEFGVVDYLFREADLVAGVSWCDSQPPVAISYIDAQGGAGKTRFAIELCREISRRGWLAGMLPRQDRGVSDMPLPRLVTVDYVEERDAAALAGQISALARSATAMTPVRVVLLSRPTRGQRHDARMDVLRQQAAASGAVIVALDAAQDRSDAVTALSVAERGVLFGSALAAFGRRWHGEQWAPSASGQVDLSGDRYGRPLDVLLEAFDAALSGPAWQSGGRPPVERALDHEERHWAARGTGFDPLLLRRCVALATLAGARDEQEAAALFALVPELAGEQGAAARQRMDQWLRGLYDGPARWNPLQPDRLAEALIARTAHDDDDSGQGLFAAVLALPSDAQAERALDVLARLADDTTIAAASADALAEQHRALVDRCARQVRGTPQQPGQTGLLESLARLHLAVLTDQRLAGLPLFAQSQLSASADLLGDLARDHGLIGEAQAIFEGALAIDQRRTQADQGNAGFRGDLAISYNKLGDLAVDAGRVGEAEGLYRQSLQLRQELAETDPSNADYRRNLTVSYDRLGDLARAAGRVGEAEGLYRQSLQLAQELAEADPGNATYRRDLAVSYNRLGDLARAAGRVGEAEGLYRQSLQLAQELAEADPGNADYRRDLAVSYNKLGDLAVDAGRVDEAEGLYRQSLQLAQELAEADPGNAGYRRDLTVSYDRLGDLAVEAGRVDEAEGLYRQSLQLAQELAEADPGNAGYRRDLTVSYDRLGDLARAAGRVDEAEGLYRQSLQLRQELAEADPGNAGYRRDLAVSYNKLGDLAVEAGRVDEAEGLYRQSLQLRQELAEADPGNATYRRDLTVSYNKLGDLAVEAGRVDEAEGLYRQSLQLRQELAEADPGNAGYRRDLAVSYNKLGDLAVEAGRVDEAEGLYRQSLQLAQELAEADPGNATYRRDLAISYEGLADLATAAGEADAARSLIARAVSFRRALHDLDQAREDLAVELAYALYLSSQIEAGLDQREASEALRSEIIQLLEPFNSAGSLSERGGALLSWARHDSGDA